MAQFLIRIQDRTHSDPTVSATLYKRGDVIDVFPDGQLQVPQPIAHWAVVTIEGLSVERARRLLEQEVVEDGFTSTVTLRRLNALDWANLPAEWVTALTTGDRALTLTLQQARNYVKNKRTGKTVTL